MRPNSSQPFRLALLAILMVALCAPADVSARSEAIGRASLTAVTRMDDPITADSPAPAAPAAATVTLTPTDDAPTAANKPTLNAGSASLAFVTQNATHAFILFDLSVLPANATIDAAELQLNILQVSAGPRAIEIGRADGAWDEATITWANEPAATWSGLTQMASAPGLLTGNVKLLVAAWQGGAANHGFALRGTGGGASVAIASSKETGVAPKLVITYSVPADNQPAPDLGDAPDSTNSAGVPMVAYAGVSAGFPTVWASTPGGQPAGPRHANQTYEGMLGNALSREAEADTGPDQDGINNIQPGAGIANNDRADDGWRNRNAPLAACQRSTLVVRVTRLPGATLDRMYLNVWFDGNRDGDWADVTACNQEGLPFQGHEWIVQDFPVNMAAIPAGGSVDLNVTTERVLNTAAGAHWMRFTLSEARSVKTAGGLTDGRGPNPPGSFSHGETEDYLQRPQPAGEDGTLTLTKTSNYAGGVVPTLGTLLFEIRLRHSGGSQPVQAGISDFIPYPLSLLPPGPADIRVLSPNGGASPLSARVEIKRSPPGTLVTWAGTLAPDSEVILRLLVQVAAYCSPGQQTTTITNVARAAKVGGAPLTAVLPFTAACANYDEDDIEVEPTVEPVGGTTAAPGPEVELPDMREVQAKVSLRNKRADSVSLALFIDTPDATAAAPDPNRRKIVGRLTLGPGETTTVNSAIKFDGIEGEMISDLTQQGDLSVSRRVGYCLLANPDGDCPDEAAFPQLVGYAQPITVTVKPHDLGDAPDSSNHAGAGMLAYPAVPARYPTVFDPATGLPQGPSHSKPKPFHLGQRVSLEVETDQGLDQDPSNNILPAANTPNRDRADDGANPSAWPLTGCQTAVVPVRVFISPAAAAWFASQSAPAYVNIWVDGNRDGDWEDGTTCPSGAAALEHLVIDHPVNAAALGAGLHTVSVPTGPAPWPANLAQQPAWVRVTLSEAKSVKPFSTGGIAHGDGRGPAQGFRTGETEDYVLRRDGAAGAGPDLELEMNATAQRREQSGGIAGANAAVTPDITTSVEVVDYLIIANRGDRTASGAQLQFTVPPPLRGLPVQIRSGQGSGDPIPTESFSLNFEEIKVTLRDLKPGERHTIVLGWYGCITCTVAAASAPEADYTASARLTLTGDADPSNNEATATARTAPRPPTIGQFMDYTDDAVLALVAWGQATTSRTDPLLGGLAEPGSAVQIIVDGKQVGTATAGADGIFTFRANLTAGLHRIFARYPAQAAAAELGNFDIQMLRLRVVPNLPFDPVTLTFTDERGRVVRPQAKGTDVAMEELHLVAGMTYQVGVNLTPGMPAGSKQDIEVENDETHLSDPDGDGRYTGEFTYNAAVNLASAAAATNARLIVWDGAVEHDYPFELQPLPEPVVRDARTKRPLAGVTVILMELISPPGRAAYFTPRSEQITGPDGTYAFSVYGGTYRLRAEKPGYQTYTSPSVEVDGIWPGRDILLTPRTQVAAAAQAASYQVHMTDDGFELAELAVRPGSTVEFVNLDLDEHTATGEGWDSGVLGPGERFKLLVGTAGAFPYSDAVELLNRGRILVAPNAPPTGNHIRLPLIRR